MKKYDLIVVGGGISGVASAVSAGREGLKVLLIEKTGALGGAISNNLVYPFMRYWIGGDKDNLVNAGIFKEIVNRRLAYNEPSYEAFKFVFDDMVAEAGVDVLFHSNVFSVSKNERNVKSVFVTANAQTLEFQADFFIDATGDGELIALSNCEFQVGRESDGLCQPMTTCFRVGGVDTEKFKEERPHLQELYKKLREEGAIKNPRENILVFFGLGEGVLHFNTTRVIKKDPTNAFELSQAEFLARRQIVEMLNFLRQNSKAFDNAYVISIANSIGVRESRKLKGEYILTAEDILSLKNFEDTIALGNYEIDIHNPEGTGTHIHYFEDGEYYKIPYRSLLPKEYDNLLVVGRCLSAEHTAHSAVRIMPICACLGEAGGIAISTAKKTGTNTHTVDVLSIRKTLIEKGARVD